MFDRNGGDRLTRILKQTLELKMSVSSVLSSYLRKIGNIDQMIGKFRQVEHKSQ